MLCNQIQQLQIRVNLGVMEIKGNFAIPRYPELELSHQMKFRFILKIPFFGGGVGLLHVCCELESAYSKPHR